MLTITTPAAALAQLDATWRIRDHVGGRVLVPFACCLAKPPSFIVREKACFSQEVCTDLIPASRDLISHHSLPLFCSSHADLVSDLGHTKLIPASGSLSLCLKCSHPRTLIDTQGTDLGCHLCQSSLQPHLLTHPSPSSHGSALVSAWHFPLSETIMLIYLLVMFVIPTRM